MAKINSQFVVLTRLTVMTLNELLIRVGSETLITYDSINEMFEAWEQFRERPDFKEHMHVWLMGGDLSTLPPVIESKAAVEDDPADLREFGGDYVSQGSSNQEIGEGEPGIDETSQEDAMPQGQNPDSTASTRPAVPVVQGNLHEQEDLAEGIDGIPPL